MSITSVFAQNYTTYRTDSLQIKVYAQIEYTNSKVKDIKITKVFCDYCSDFQKEALENEAYSRVAYEAYYPDFLVENGKRRQALNIRVSKKDFAELKMKGIEQKTEEVIENN